MNPGSRIFGFDLVRAFAILFVLMAHIALQFEPLGFYGVEVFFGLSGFLIGKILIRNFFQAEGLSFRQLINFWQRRWWRTLPVYYLFFLVSVVFHFFFGGLPDWKELINFLSFTPYLTNHHFGFYVVSWSLFIEEWFYLLFPFLLVAFSGTGIKPRFVFPVCLSVIFVGCLIFKIAIIQSASADSLRWITLGRLDAIGYGVLIAYLDFIRKFHSRQKLFLFTLGCAFLLLPAIFFYCLKVDFEKYSQLPFTLIVTPLGSALLLPFVSSLTVPSMRFFGLRSVIEKLSLWSYSLYLCHFPILFTIYNLGGDLRESTIGNLISKAVAVITSVGCSALLYRYVELPLTNRRPPEIHISSKEILRKVSKDNEVPETAMS